MAYSSLPTLNVGDPVRASYVANIDANLDDHEARLLVEEAATTDHETRIGTLESSGVPAALADLTDVALGTPLSAGDVLEFDGAVWTNATPAAGSGAGVIGLVIDGAGSEIATGVKGFIRVPTACTITKATLLSIDASATSGSIVIDVWKDSFANYPPTNADSITASAPPTLSSANKSEDATLTGWTTSISAGDVLGFNVDSVSTVTRVLLMLEVTP